MQFGIATTVLKKNNETEELKLAISKLAIKLVTKTVCYWHKDRHTDQANKTETLEMKVYTHSQLPLTRMPIPTSEGKQALQQTVMGQPDAHMLSCFSCV